jgi:hypothetical protein
MVDGAAKVQALQPGHPSAMVVGWNDDLAVLGGSAMEGYQIERDFEAKLDSQFRKMIAKLLP